MAYCKSHLNPTFKACQPRKVSHWHHVVVGILALLVLLTAFDALAAGRTDVVAISDIENVPGVPGGQFGYFEQPYLNATSQVAFLAGLKPGFGGVTNQNLQSIFATGSNGNLTMIARAGVIGVPGLPGEQFSTLSKYLAFNNSGQLAFNGTLELSPTVTSANRSGLWMHDANNSLTLVGRSGASNVPGLPGTNFERFFTLLQNSLSDSGNLVYRAELQPGFGGVSNDNNYGLWTSNSLGTQSLIAQSGSGNVPGVPGGSFYGLFSQAVPLNAGGTIFYADAETAVGSLISSSIWRADNAGNLSLVLLTGENSSPVPGIPSAKFGSLSEIDIHPSGNIAFLGYLEEGFGGVVSSTSSGIWGPNGSGGLKLIARKESNPNGITYVPGVDGANFSNFQDVKTNANGQVAFRASMIAWRGHNTVNPSNATGIWGPNASGNIALIARTGSGNVPNLPGANFNYLDPDVLLNDKGNVVFYAQLQTEQAGITSSNNRGIWIADHLETLEVVRTGNVLAGSTVIDVLEPSLNDFGQVAYRASFADGNAIFLFTPELHWRSAGAGANTWDNRQKWTLSQVPATVHPLVIDPAANTTIVGPSANTTIRSLIIGGGSGTTNLNLSQGVVLTTVEGTTVKANGILSGAGTLAGGLTVEPNGIVAPGNSPGILTIDGEFIHQGTTEFEIVSLLNFDQILVNGSASLAGTFAIKVDEYTPQLNDTFDLIDFEGLSLNGLVFDFSNAPLTAGLQWDTSRFWQDGTISVVPEPSAQLLMSLGVVGFLGTLRWRKVK